MKAFTLTKLYWFWYKGSINNSLGITWKFCLRNFKNSEIDCTIYQKKNHSLFELQKIKIGNVAAIWLCKKYDSEGLRHLKKCFDVSKIIFNYNQMIDKISHWNLKLITRNITTNITTKILQTGFHVKKRRVQVSFGVFFLFTGL